MGRRGGPAQAQSPPAPTPHVAPAFHQVVAVDLDEGLNGLVSYRMQVGMPRMDFLINSTSGAVVTSAELDRERIAEYQLRVVASDAGTPTKSATSTLTIRGEGRGCLLPRGERLVPGAVPGRLGSPRPLLLSLSMGTQGALLTRTPPQPCHSAQCLLPPSPKCQQSLLPTEPLPSVPPGAWTHCQGSRSLPASLNLAKSREDLRRGGWGPRG